jgi:hypothetical protein
MCFIDTLFPGGCGVFDYTLTVAPAIAANVIALNQENSTVFSISVSPTSNS